MRKILSTPGSPPAIEKGCICPVIDNLFGSGRLNQTTGQREFIMDFECPLHGTGLKLAQNNQLAQGSNADSAVEPDA
ncbi:MAG: hypothetical protein AAFN38_21790 [Cyanobacteria bacterium J06560_5]